MRPQLGSLGVLGLSIGLVFEHSTGDVGAGLKKEKVKAQDIVNLLAIMYIKVSHERECAKAKKVLFPQYQMPI